MGLIADAFSRNSKTGDRSPFGIGLDAKLREILQSLTGDNQSPGLRLAAELAAYAYLEHWLSNISAAIAQADGKAIHPALNQRQTYTQRRLLRALESVEQIRALTRPRRIAIEI